MDDLDVFGGFGARGAGKSNPMRPDGRSANDPISFDYDSIFRSTEKNSYGRNSFNDNSNHKKNDDNDVPVYDKPVYDEDIFEGLPGLSTNRPNAASPKGVRFDGDVFASVSGKSGGEFDDLLGNLSKNNDKGVSSGKSATSAKGFDDLLAGLGGSNANRSIPEPRWGSMPTAGPKHGSSIDDPFVVLQSNSTSGSQFGVSDPLEEISKLGKSKSTRVKASTSSTGAFDDLDPLNTVGKSTNSFSTGRENIGKDKSPPRAATPQSASARDPKGNSLRHSESDTEKNVPIDILQEPPLFYSPNVSTEFHKSFGQNDAYPTPNKRHTQVDMSSTSEPANQSNDIWLTVSEIPLFTQPTTAPPPSRAPPMPRQTSRFENGTYSSSSQKKSDGYSSPKSNRHYHYQSPRTGRPSAKGPPVSQFDELEEFAMGRSQNSYDGSANLQSNMDGDVFSAAAASAAAMKDAMDNAQARFRHAKDLREREYAKIARNKESEQLEKDDEVRQERKLKETQERLERERKQKEEEEREQRRLEMERERERERLMEIERERGRQAYERATREVRERTAAESRMRADKSALEKSNVEARERDQRAAVHRVQAEARERLAAAARERMEKAAAEAKERTDAEEREKEMRDKAAVAAKMNQQKNDDLEYFFGMGQASSAPRTQTSSTDPLFDQKVQSKAGSDAAKTSSTSGASSNMRKASSNTNFVDDLSSIFGAAASSSDFQDVEGESEERRKARLERHQRTQERVAKALAEKNQQDLQAQRDQEERHRIAETLDIEIKRWAAGKEGNLRALLSTLQYVLWPECGWQPVSLTDLITGASVKKVYRKATLCIHPDKVQQKGATLQQKYIAENVFDLLKEAWNKFNSEELF